MQRAQGWSVDRLVVTLIQVVPVPSSSLLLLAALMAACTESRPSPVPAANTVGAIAPAATLRQPSAPLGNRTALPNQAVAVLSHRLCPEATTFAAVRDGITLALEVELTNLSRTPLLVNPFYFTVVDRDRVRYTTSLGDCPPSLAAKPLMPSQKVRGTVTFELPRSVMHLTVEYRPLDTEGALARFEFDR